MKAPYQDELDALPAVYRVALHSDVDLLRKALYELGRGPAVFIGAGGTAVLAQLAARLHEISALQPATAATALQALALPQLTRRGAMLFSSSAKHPDARLIARDFRRRRFSPTAIVTHRGVSETQHLVGPDTIIVQMPALSQPDGFLATGSIMQAAVALFRGYLRRPQLPAELVLSKHDEPRLRDEVLVLYPPDLLPVAADIEVRLVESGLAAVQIADYRNFAHGRHTGFARRIDGISVIGLSNRSSFDLAATTLATLDRRAAVSHWHEDAPWAAATIALLARSMCLAGVEGARASLDVARPKVPPFGRALYRLPLNRRITSQYAGSVRRKLLALGAGERDVARETYAVAAAEWSDEQSSRRFLGLVLDYDGTVCWTAKRFELPDAQIRGALTDLLGNGLHIGFASGRGRSLHQDLRQWVPECYWRRVLVGLYNGAVRLRLDETLPDLRIPTEWSNATVSALAKWPFAEMIEIQERGLQVTVTPLAPFEHEQLAKLAADQLARTNVRARVLASAHSVDIVAPDTHKEAVTADLEAAAGGTALAIGDQGQIGGNDHDLLAHCTSTLTVDRCSADPTRCWYAGNGMQTGPDQLLRYLRSLKRRRDGFAIHLELM